MTAVCLALKLDQQIFREHALLQVPFLQRLVQMPSDNPPGDCVPHAELAAGLLRDLDFTVQSHPVPAALVRQHGMRSVTNLIVRHVFGDGTGPVLALNAHGDVVPPGGGWSADPYGGEIRQGVLYGRGAAVSKSDFATYAFALRSVIGSGLPLNGTAEIHLTYDEETGGQLGPGWLLAEGLTRPDYVISAGFTYGIMVAHNGCLQLQVRLTGRAAHAAWPELGTDVLFAANRLLTALYASRETLRQRSSNISGITHPTLVIGTMHAGLAVNVVPEDAVIRIDRRILPEESPQAVEQELRSIIEAAVLGEPRVKCVIERILLAAPLVPDPSQDRLVDALRGEAVRVFGEAIPALGMPLFTDARLYSAAGAATVLYGAGPRVLEEANGHRADEHLQLRDLLRATRVVAGTISHLLAT